MVRRVNLDGRISTYICGACEVANLVRCPGSSQTASQSRGRTEHLELRAVVGHDENLSRLNITGSESGRTLLRNVLRAETADVQCGGSGVRIHRLKNPRLAGDVRRGRGRRRYHVSIRRARVYQRAIRPSVGAVQQPLNLIGEVDFRGWGRRKRKRLGCKSERREQKK